METLNQRIKVSHFKRVGKNPPHLTVGAYGDGLETKIKGLYVLDSVLGEGWGQTEKQETQQQARTDQVRLHETLLPPPRQLRRKLDPDLFCGPFGRRACQSIKREKR